MMKKKEIIFGVLGIVLLVCLAFFVASYINKVNQDKINMEKKEKAFFIEDKEVKFKTFYVDKSFFINVPNNMKPLNSDMLKQKYNYNDRPELVFESSDDLAHIFISTTDVSMTDERLSDYLENRVSALTNMAILKKNTYNKYKKVFANLVCSDSNIYYNYLFFTINDKLVTVEFNIAYNKLNDYEKVIEEVMKSICFLEDDIKKYK